MNLPAGCVLSLLLLSCAPQPATVQVAAHETAREAIPQIAPTTDAGTCRLPDPALTPGALCTANDPDFDGYRYREHVAHCRRHVTAAEKDVVAKAYGVPRSEWGTVEFDHLIPLALGGSNSTRNIWCQPLYPDARLKDREEDRAYLELRNGVITQAEAVARMRAWTCLR